MDIDNAEKIIDKSKRQPRKVFLIVVVIFVFTILIAYTTTFTSKKAEQHAKPTPPSAKTQPQNNIQAKQQTEGDQSPAINTNEGDVIINYGGGK
jgi:flagellar basal body-associated protein FliL